MTPTQAAAPPPDSTPQAGSTPPAGSGRSNPTPSDATPSATAQWRAITTLALADRWAMIAIISVLMVAMGLIVGALWPSMQSSLGEFANAPEAMTALAGGSALNTPAGWVNAEMLSIIAPVGVIAIAVSLGGRAIATEEETKTISTLLSTPTSRSTLMAAKLAALVIATTIVGVAIWVGLLLANPIGGLGLSVSGVTAASLQAVLLGVLFGAVAFTVGVWRGSRRLAAAVAAALAAAAFFAASFLPLAESLADLAKLSPWYYYTADNPILLGFTASNIAVLLSVTVVVTAPGWIIFTRRSLR